MSGSRELAEHYADLLEPLGEIDLRRFFGGWGLRHRGQLFAIVMDTIYLRVDAGLRSLLAETGSAPFTYHARGRPVVVRRFYTVPEPATDDAGALCEYARLSIEALGRER